MPSAPTPPRIGLPALSPPSSLALPPAGLAILVGFLSMLGAFSIDTYLPAFRAITHDLSTSEVVVQQTMSAYLFAFALMTLWHGTLSDYIGRRPVILGGITVYILASIGCALAQSINFLILFRILQGASAGVGGIVGRAVIRDCLEGASAQKALAYSAMTFSIAPAAAPIIGGLLLNTLGWRAIFWFIVAFSILMLLICWRLLPETHPSHLRPLSALNNLGALWKNYTYIFLQSRFQLPALMLGLHFGGVFLYISSAPRFLIDHLGLSTQEFAWLFLPVISGVALGSFLNNRLAGRLTAKKTIQLGFLILLSSAGINLVIAYFLRPQVPLHVLPLGCYGMGMALIAPTITLLLFDTFPERRGVLSSLQSFVQMMIAAIVAGIIAPVASLSLLGLAATMAALTMLSYGLWIVWNAASHSTASYITKF